MSYGEEDLTTIKDRLLQSHSEVLQAERQGQRDRAKVENLNGILSVAIDRIKVIVVQASTGNETVESVAALTLALLQVSSHMNVAKTIAFVCTLCGAVVERLQDDRFRSDDHCRALFQLVVNILKTRKHCLEQGELADVDAMDSFLEGMCPPLMTFFANRLELLKELRNVPEVTSLINDLPKSMLRMFLKQLVDETVLCAFVKTSETETTPSITFAQRVSFTGLPRNDELALWAISSGQMPSEIQDLGEKIEMDCWTALRSNDWEKETWEGTHRIWHEGIPDDIAPLDEERVVLFHIGSYGRYIHSTQMFPYIEMQATLKGPPLNDEELQGLEKRIQQASKEEVIAALKHQQKRGGADDDLQSCIDQLEKTERESV